MLEYQFKNKKLLNTAFTHISYANERGVVSNQRLEFLGDSILSFIIALHIYNDYPDLPEGMLTEMRACIVCEKSLAKASRELGLGKKIKFGRSEAMSNGQDKDSILADTFEALLAAIYLDSDFETAKQWTLNVLHDVIENIDEIDIRNYKSEIQTYFQKKDKGREVVCYKLKSKVGPDHSPSFVVEAMYKNKVIGVGSGKNRKKAEQNAARVALENLVN